MKNHKILIDGGVGTQGRVLGIAWRITDSLGDTITDQFRLAGTGLSCVADWLAAIAAMREALGMGITRARLYTDSTNVSYALRGRGKKLENRKESVREHVGNALELKRAFELLEVEWIPSHTNPLATMMTERIRRAVRNIPPDPSPAIEAKRGFIWKLYEEREKSLRSLGVASYRDYLRSETWIRIRSRVMSRDNGRCRTCGAPAREVHHNRYDLATMRGDSIDSLMGLCPECHDVAENGKRSIPSVSNDSVRAYT